MVTAYKLPGGAAQFSASLLFTMAQVDHGGTLNQADVIVSNAFLLSNRCNQNMEFVPFIAASGRYDRRQHGNVRYRGRRLHQVTSMTLAADKSANRPAAGRKYREFNWEDPLDLEGELSEEERMARDTARGYARDKLFPRIKTAFREERFDREIMIEMGALGLIGATVPQRYRRRWARPRGLRADCARNRMGGLRRTARQCRRSRLS